MNLFYITILVITTLTPSEGWMQHAQGFKDKESCISYLNQPGVKKMVTDDLKYETSKILLNLGEYTCMTRKEATKRNMKVGHGEMEI
jgi:hypothetical protein|tara:strand:+ start:27 stop:287 length:261 start_codon:yes stop_codon:yes gene_type:complete